MKEKERPKSIPEDLRGMARAAVFGGLTAAMYGTFKVHETMVGPDRRGSLLDRYRRAWLQATMELFGVELTVVPGPPRPPTGPRLVVSNHRSALDILVLMKVFEGHFLSRADLKEWPLLGALARLGGTIFVDRADGASRTAAAMAVRRKLSEGRTVIVFPEGTTFAGDDVRTFHGGAFAAGRDLGVEVVPVGIAYPPGTEFGDETFLEHLKRVANRRRTQVVAYIGQPGPLEDDPRAMAETYRREVQELVYQARKVLEERERR